MAIRPDFLQSVEPAAAPPNDYQNIRATPQDFGAQVGQAETGLGRAGVGAGEAGLGIATMRQERFNAVATDDSYNKLADVYHNLTYGDPNDPSKPGIYSMKGADALAAYPTTNKALSDARQQIRDGLQNDAQRLAFDQQSRRLQMFTADAIGRHVDQQSDVYATAVGQNTVTTQARRAGSYYNDDTQFADAIVKARIGSVNAEKSRLGQSITNEMADSAIAAADSKLITDRAMAWGAQDPGAALNWLKTGMMPGPVNADGTHGPDVPVSSRLEPQTMLTLTTHFQGKADEQAGQSIGMGAAAAAMHTHVGPATPAILEEAPKQGVPVTTALTFAKIESDLGAAPDEPGNSHTGVYQMGPAEFAANGGNPAERGNLVSEVRAGIISIPKSMAIASDAVGAPAQPWQGYIVHQQGAAGGPALLKAPATDNVVDALTPAYNGNRAVATMAIIRNGGRPDMTTGDFLGMWRAKYADAEASVSGSALPGTATAPITEVAQTQVLQNIIQQTQGNPRQQEAALGAAERMFALNKKMQQDAAETASNAIVTQLLKDPTKVTPESIANNPNLTATEKWNLNRMTKEAILEGSDNKDTKTYGTGFYDLFQKIHAPQGDPSRITDPSVLYPHVGPSGDLTVAGVDKLTAEIQARRSPEGEAESEMRKQFMVNARAQITGSNEMTHMRDPKGDEIYLKFLAQFLPQYDAGRKAGKTPAEMLDPDSKDYLGKSIATFKRPMSVQVKDMADAANEFTADQGEKVDLTTQEGIKAAFQAGKITREQGRRLLDNGGYTAPQIVKPPAPTLVPTN